MPKSRGRRHKPKKKKSAHRRGSLFTSTILNKVLDHADDILYAAEQRVIQAMPSDCRTPHITDGAGAQSLLHRARQSAEQVGLEYAQAMGTYSWLFYLRRISPDIVRGHISNTAPYRIALAEVMSTKTILSETYDPSYKRNFVPPLDRQSAEALLGLCGVGVTLQRIHASLRRAGKGQHIIWKADDLPGYIEDSSIDRTISIYDRRVEEGRGQGENGFEKFYPVATKLVSPVRLSELILTVTHRYPVGPVPQWTGPLCKPRGKIGNGRYIAGGTSLSAISRMTALASSVSPWADERLASLVLFLRVMFRLIYASDLGFGSSLPTVGYTVLPTAMLEELAALEISQAKTDLEAMGLNDVPADPAVLLDNIEALPISLWPLTPGPVLRSAGEQTIVDISTASMWLRDLLTVSNAAEGSMIQARADHFELFVQEEIDRSRWRPPESLRDLRGRTLRLSGRMVTDIDAIAMKDNVILLVSCKSMPYTRDLDAGVYNSVRNVRTALKGYDEEWVERVKLFNEYPCGDNYDLRGYRIIGAVCIPFVAYTEVEQTRVVENVGENALRAVCSIGELQQFLQ